MFWGTPRYAGRRPHTRSAQRYAGARIRAAGALAARGIRALFNTSKDADKSLSMPFMPRRVFIFCPKMCAHAYNVGVCE